MTLANELKQFIGTEHWYRVTPFSRITITDGVKYFADKGGAYWAVTDIIAIATALKQEFLVAKLVSEHGKAKVQVEDGNGNIFEIATQEYPFTDLEEGEYKFYITDNVMMLPSEY